MKNSKFLATLGIALCILGFSRSSLAAIGIGDTLFIDFGRTDPANGIAMPANATMDTGAGNSTHVADGLGHYWNNAWMNSAQGGGVTPPSLVNLVNSADTGTGVGLSFSNGWQANGFANGGLTQAQITANQAILGDFAFRNALGDYYFLNKGDGPGTTSMTFSGLNPSLTYNFQMFGTRETTDVRTTLYSITDVNGLHTYSLQTSGPGIGTGGYNGNNDEFAIFSGIVPDALGNITLSLTNTAGNFSYIGALSLTAVPEPSSLGIVTGVGCLALIALRRRRRSERCWLA